MNNEIEKRIDNIKNKVNVLAQKFNRNGNEIEIVAVSKFQSIEKILAAYDAGIRNFAESYIQEWLEKQRLLSYLKDINWHMIGHLQKNKVKYLDAQIYCLQSLDSVSLAKEIEKKYPFTDSTTKKLKVLIQLQIDKSDLNKSGISFTEAGTLCEYVMQSKKLQLCGFMGIGPQKVTEKKHRKDLYLRFVDNAMAFWHGLYTDSKPIISLGMSDDMETAIQCGTNMLRIGSAIFGGREKNAST